MTGVRHSPEEWREWMFVGGLLAVFAAFHGAHSSFFRHMVERDHFPVLAVSNTLMGIALLMLGGIMVLLDKGGVLILNTATWTSRTFASRFLLLSALFAGLRVAEQAAVAYGSPSDALYVLRCGVPCAAVALEHWLCGLRLTRAQVMAMFAVLLAVALEIPRVSLPFVGQDSSITSFAFNLAILACNAAFLLGVAHVVDPAQGHHWDVQDVIATTSGASGAMLLVADLVMGDWGALSSLGAASTALWAVLSTAFLLFLMMAVFFARIVAISKAGVLATQFAAFLPVLLFEYLWRAPAALAALAPALGVAGIAALVATSSPRLAKRTQEEEQALAEAADDRVRQGVAATQAAAAASVVFAAYLLAFEVGITKASAFFAGTAGSGNPTGLLLTDLALQLVPLAYLLRFHLLPGKQVERALYATTAVLLLNYAAVPFDAGPQGLALLLLLRGGILWFVAGAADAARTLPEEGATFDSMERAPMVLNTAGAGAGSSV